MKSAAEIQVDFQNAMNQASKLDSIADAIDRRVAGAIENAEQGVHAVWKGESAAKYLNKTQSLRSQIRQTARDLRETAADIRRIARRMHEAEMHALEIAQRRDS